jgi:hypothetical protein
MWTVVRACRAEDARTMWTISRREGGAPSCKGSGGDRNDYGRHLAYPGRVWPGIGRRPLGTRIESGRGQCRHSGQPVGIQEPYEVGHQPTCRLTNPKAPGFMSAASRLAP